MWSSKVFSIGSATLLIAVILSQFIIALSSPVSIKSSNSKRSKISTSRKYLVGPKRASVLANKFSSKFKTRKSDGLKYAQRKVKQVTKVGSQNRVHLKVRSSVREEKPEWYYKYMAYKAKMKREKKQEAERKAREKARKEARKKRIAKAKAKALAKARYLAYKKRHSQAERERRWVWLLRRRRYKFGRKYPLACSCTTAARNSNSKCYYLSPKPHNMKPGQTGSCKKRQCNPQYVCVSGRKTGLVCIRRITRTSIKPLYPGFCIVGKHRSKPMYVPYAQEAY